MKRLYLFTAMYPYGVSRESYLETELIYLSKLFDKIIIVPYGSDTTAARPVPQNCEVLDPVSLKFKRLRRVFCFRSFLPMFVDMVNNKVFFNKTKFKSWQIAYANSNLLLSSRTIRKIEKDLTADDVCYFYWGKGSNMLAYFWKRKAKMVSRFHGDWDLWEDRYGGYAPIRKKIVDSLDYAIHISSKGEEYFKQRYPNCKTVKYPLGTIDYGVGIPDKNKSTIKVLSCSTVYPLKRVDLIFRSLNACKNLNIEWTHIGDGVSYEELKNIVNAECGGHLKVNLLGRKSHQEVMDYYLNNHVDVFINLSTMEGVPVAIMEAMSFDVPIIATNVGCTCEEVTDQSGLLLPENPTIEEVSNSLERIIQLNLKPRLFWKNNYSAEKNYKEFAEFLYRI